MRIIRPSVPRQIVEIEANPKRAPLVRTVLDCGHSIVLTRVEDKIMHILSGVMFPKKLTDNFQGQEANVGSEVRCYKCSEEAYQTALRGRPAVAAERFETRDALETAHPNAKWESYGPVHQHGDKHYVQVYLGAHEWVALNVEDVRDAFWDPGWDGTEFGWAYIHNAEEHIRYALDQGLPKQEIDPPLRPGKPITRDAYLFAEPDKLRADLDPMTSPSKAAIASATEPNVVVLYFDWIPLVP